MMATLADDLPTGPGWAYELKWDGVRVLADIRAGTLALGSRRGNDVTVSYPELADLVDVLDDALLDGEVVTFAGGRPSFEALQPRMHVRDPKRVAQLTKLIPITYLVLRYSKPVPKGEAAATYGIPQRTETGEDELKTKVPYTSEEEIRDEKPENEEAQDHTTTARNVTAIDEPSTKP